MLCSSQQLLPERASKFSGLGSKGSMHLWQSAVQKFRKICSIPAMVHSPPAPKVTPLPGMRDSLSARRGFPHTLQSFPKPLQHHIHPITRTQDTCLEGLKILHGLFSFRNNRVSVYERMTSQCCFRRMLLALLPSDVKDDSFLRS